MMDNNLFQAVGNFFVKGILNSTAHRLLSGSTMLLSFSGRISGDRITVPVNYAVSDGEVLVSSQKNRTWWKNLRNGAPVTVKIKGKRLEGWAEVLEDPDLVNLYFKKYLDGSPDTAKRTLVKDAMDFSTKSADSQESVTDRVMVRIKIKN